MDTSTVWGTAGALLKDEPLSLHTTFGIGGPAAYFARPADLDELAAIVREASDRGVPLRVIGSGSNILVSDRGVRGLVVKLDRPFFTGVTFLGDTVTAGAGALVASVIRLSREQSLGGLEFLAGLPATVGGAAVMNAGAWGKHIGEYVESVDVLDRTGRQRLLEGRVLAWGYRRSGLEKYIVYRVRVRLVPKDPAVSEEEAGSFMRQRLERQDTASRSAGCVFRNPESAAAGRLIEDCGLKGRRVGGAVVSDKHANFIVNSGHATAADVMKLMALVRRAVKRSSGIALRNEIKIWK